MARGNDPGKDFDNQFNKNRAAGQRKAAKGESHWAADKARGEFGQMRQPSGQEKSCGKAAAIITGFYLSGVTLGWLAADLLSWS